MKRIFEERAKALEILRESKGRVFSVSFVKRTNGEVRTMNCRTGVHKGVKGTGSKIDPSKYGLMTVFDMHSKNYRMINLDRLLTAQIAGTEYIFH